jgi:heme exporter protein C
MELLNQAVARWVAFWEFVDAKFDGVAGVALRYLFFIAMSITIVASFVAKDAPAFQEPALARIFFWHFPCSLISSWLLGQGAWYSFRFIRSKELRWDVKAISALELGMIFSVLTMVTGIIFSKSEWGAYWQWDPRQSSYLLVLLMYGGYFILRAAFADRERSAANSAGYALAAVMPALFLTFIFPRLPQIDAVSLHPTKTVLQGLVAGDYAKVLPATITLITLLSMWLFRLRVRAGLLELKTYECFGLETYRGDTAAPRVVRPVRLPSDDGEQTASGDGPN